MSAHIIPFPREASGPVFLRSPFVQQAEAAAIRDARRIRGARLNNDDWTARLLLAILETLDRKQLESVEFRLLGTVTDSAQPSASQALAIVQLATGNKDHRERVSSALSRMMGGGQ